MDAGVQHRRRRPPRHDLRDAPPTATETAGRRRAAGRRRRSARAGRSATGSAAPRWSAGPTSARSSWSSGPPHRRPDLPDAHFVVTEPTTSPPRTAPAWCTSPPPSARTTSRSCRRYGAAGGQPDRPDGPLRRRRAAGRRAVLQARRHRPGRRPRRRAACCSGTCPTSTATRTAGAATPRCSTTRSRPGTSAPPQIKDDAARARTRRPTGSPTTIKHGRYGDWLSNNIDWALSRSRYWGTPLPIWRCDEDHQTCVGSLRRALRADRHRPVRARPAPAVRRRRHVRLPDVRRTGPPGARGDRRLVRLRLDAVRPVGLPARRGLGADARAGLPGRLHLRGDRPDPRLVLHADGGRHAGLRRVVVPERALPRATSWPRTAARCPSTSATSSSRSR